MTQCLIDGPIQELLGILFLHESFQEDQRLQLGMLENC